MERITRFGRCWAIVLLFFTTNLCAEGDVEESSSYSELYQVITSERNSEIMYLRAAKLIEAGENINFVQKSKRGTESSVLAAAVDRQHYGLVNLLLVHGANPNPIHEKGCTPIGGSITYKNQEIIKLLIDYGADLSKKACYDPSRKKQSGLNFLLISPVLVENETRIYAIERHVQAGRELDSSLLKSMIRKGKVEVVKRMIELQPEILNEQLKNRIENSNNDEIRKLVKLYN